MFLLMIMLLCALVGLWLIPKRQGERPTLSAPIFASESPRQLQVKEDLQVFGDAYREAELVRHREEVLQRVAAMATPVPTGKK